MLDALSREGNVFVVEEEEQKYEDEKPERITWRCTFEYPQRRTMEAVDSLWADRVDILRPTNGGTRWTIRWYTKTGGVRGIIQYLVFRLVGHRRLRKSTIDPVKSHFEGQGAQQ